MSSTFRFTPLQPPDHPDDYVYTSRNEHGAGVKIIDLDGLKEALSDTFVNIMDVREVTEKDEYPHQTWKQLLGFTTYGREEIDRSTADYHNLSNMSMMEMRDLWETVSEYTEPFILYQTGFEGAWPDPAAIERSPPHPIYRVEADNGDVEVTKLLLGVVDEEPVEL